MSALTELPARLIMRERRGWTLELAQHTNDELIISQWELGHLGYLQPTTAPEMNKSPDRYFI